MWQEFNVNLRHRGVDLDLQVKAHPGSPAMMTIPLADGEPEIRIVGGTIDGIYADGDDIASMYEDQQLLNKLINKCEFTFTCH